MVQNIRHAYCSTKRGRISSPYRIRSYPQPASPAAGVSFADIFPPMNLRLRGTLVRGHRVASRPSKDYPYSALKKQMPFFKTRGLDLYRYFNGTLNISIAPLTFAMSAPQFTFELIEWTDLHPPETFSFSRCKVIFKDVEYPGWVYYPHPETKRNHFQNPSLIEAITHEIPAIRYGEALDVEVDEREITVSGG